MFCLLGLNTFVKTMCLAFVVLLLDTLVTHSGVSHSRQRSSLYSLVCKTSCYVLAAVMQQEKKKRKKKVKLNRQRDHSHRVTVVFNYI